MASAMPSSHAADLGDDGRVGVESRLDRLGPVEEQAGGGLVVQGGDRAQGLAGDAERFAAGREHPYVRAGGEDAAEHAGGVVDDVFAVVHDQHDVPCRQRGPQPVLDAERPGRQESGLADPETVEQRAGDVGGGTEVDERHLARLPMGDLDGEPRLARTAGADQRDQPVVAQPLRHAPQVLVAADEAGELRGHTSMRRLGPQHLQVRGSEHGGGIDTQLVGQ